MEKIASWWMFELFVEKNTIDKEWYFYQLYESWYNNVDFNWYWKDWLIKIIKHLCLVKYQAEIILKTNSDNKYSYDLVLSYINKIDEIISNIQDYEIKFL